MADLVIGVRYLLTIIFSTTLDNIGVTEIGLKSEKPLTGEHLGTGVMCAVFQEIGTSACWSE
jgi:hypothetical protein